MQSKIPRTIEIYIICIPFIRNKHY